MHLRQQGMHCILRRSSMSQRSMGRGKPSCPTGIYTSYTMGSSPSGPGKMGQEGGQGGGSAAGDTAPFPASIHPLPLSVLPISRLQHCLIYFSGPGNGPPVLPPFVTALLKWLATLQRQNRVWLLERSPRASCENLLTVSTAMSNN